MDQLQTDQKFLGTDSEQSRRLFSVYDMLDHQEKLDELMTTLMLGTNDYFYSTKTARELAGVKGRVRSTYSADVIQLMDYSINERVDSIIEQTTIDLLTSALNNYLADKQNLTGDSKRDQINVQLVKTLMIQIISQGLITLLDGLKIPKYIQPIIDKINSDFSEKADIIFNQWIDDLIELGNEHLVDYVNSIGPTIFGLGRKTKAIVLYPQYFTQYLKDMKNAGEVYERYLLRSKEYREVTVNILKSSLYDYFGLTANSFNKLQRRLLDEFQLLYNNDINSQYILRLIHGID